MVCFGGNVDLFHEYMVSTHKCCLDIVLGWACDEHSNNGRQTGSFGR